MLMQHKTDLPLMVLTGCPSHSQHISSGSLWALRGPHFSPTLIICLLDQGLQTIFGGVYKGSSLFLQESSSREVGLKAQLSSALIHDLLLVALLKKDLIARER